MSRSNASDRGELLLPLSLRRSSLRRRRVADRTQAAHPPSVMLEVDLARILEDQNVPAPGTTGQRALSQAGSELIGSKMTVGEEAGVGHRRRQLTNPSGRLV